MNLYEISNRIEESEIVSPAELRLWVQSRGPRPFENTKRGQYTRDVVVRHQVQRLEEASQVKLDGGGRILKADEQREFNRLLAEAGEFGLILNEADRSEAEGERKFRQLFGPSGIYGKSDEQSDTKLWLPTLAEYKRAEMEGKAASIGSDPAGGYLIQTQLGPFVDRLRPSSVVLQANPRVVQMDVDSMELPRLGTSATVYAVGEAQSKTESSPSYERVRLSARKYAVRSLGSEEWFSDTGVEGRRILQLDQEKQLAAKIDSEFLQGAGAGSSPILGLSQHRRHYAD
jgi:HK97 family phage major capsid protein